MLPSCFSHFCTAHRVCAELKSWDTMSPANIKCTDGFELKDTCARKKESILLLLTPWVYPLRRIKAAWRYFCGDWYSFFFSLVLIHTFKTSAEPVYHPLPVLYRHSLFIPFCLCRLYHEAKSNTNSLSTTIAVWNSTCLCTYL